jgi:hypothetical protein
VAKKKLNKDGWPEKKNEPLSFTDICDPLVKALRFAYKLERRNRDKNIPYKGPNIGPREQASCLAAKHQLTSEALIYSEEDQGRNADDEIIGLAIRLGIEQGRRLERQDDYGKWRLKLAWLLLSKEDSTDEQREHALGLLKEEADKNDEDDED